jgi:hypothetical protein
VAPSETNAADQIHWTPSLVEERLAEAADVLKRLPPVKMRGYFSSWPTIISEFGDLVGREPAPVKRPCPSPAEISRMEECLGWTIGLDAVDSKIVWMRAFKERWKRICAQTGKARPTAALRWTYALCLIAWRLNGEPISKSQSRNQVIAMIRFGRDQKRGAG